MTATALLESLANKEIKFVDVIAYIEARYEHTPTAFDNGNTKNQVLENQGSAKVFSFAQLTGLDKEQTLQLFAEHYETVLATPDEVNHQNIRQFMQHGWEGIRFYNNTLVSK